MQLCFLFAFQVSTGGIPPHNHLQIYSFFLISKTFFENSPLSLQKKIPVSNEI